MTKIWDKIKDISEKGKTVTTIGLATVIANAISGIFWIYIASLLGAAHYGEVNYFIAIATAASTISLLGIPNTVLLYTAKGEKIQATVFFIAIISGIVASIVLFFISYNAPTSVFTFGSIIFGLVTSQVLGMKMYNTYSKYLITQKILMVILALVCYYLIGQSGIILGIGLSFFPYLITLYQGFKQSKIDFSLIKPHLGFMANSYALDMTGVLSTSVDKLIIAPILGFELLGNFSLGMQVLAVLSILPSSVFKYILPHDATGNPNKILKKAAIFASVGLAILGITLSPIVTPIFFPKYTSAIVIIQIISLSIIPNTIGITYISKLLGYEKMRFILISYAGYTVTNLSSIIILGRIFGINGAAMALVLASLVEMTILITFDRYLKKMV